MKELLWVFPKRVFEEGEEALFLERIGQYCEVKTLRTGPGIVRKADHIVLTAGVGLLIFILSMELVSVQELPGRWAFNYWGYAVILMMPCLPALLYAAIRLIRSSKGTWFKCFSVINLIVLAASVVLWLPFGQSSDAAYYWSAFLVIILGMQIGALWISAAGSGTVPRTFERSLTIIALAHLGWAMVFLVLCLLAMPGAGLTLQTFYENIPDPMSMDPYAKTASEAVYVCAVHWITGTIGAAGACFSLLCMGVVSAFHEKKALPRLLMMIAATALLFFCRWCRSPLEFILWTVTICGLFVLCLREIRNKKSG